LTGFGQSFLDGEPADSAGGYVSQLGQDAGLWGPTDMGPIFGNQDAFDAGRGIARDAELAAAIAMMVTAPITAAAAAESLGAGTAVTGGAAALAVEGGGSAAATAAGVGAVQFGGGLWLFKGISSGRRCHRQLRQPAGRKR